MLIPKRRRLCDRVNICMGMLVTLLLAGCGEVTTPVAQITLNLSPTSASLSVGGTQQFRATVTGTTNTTISWSATGGSISSSGLYTAPNTAGTYTVKATSVADTTKSAQVAISVTP